MRVNYHIKDATNPLKNIMSIDDFLDSSICKDIIDKAEETNKWKTNRHKNYPTTDIPLRDIVGLDNTMTTGIIDHILDKTLKLYDLEEGCEMDPYDIFVVKYDTGGQTGLDVHRDSSELSFIVLLSDPKDFEGGGTYYEESDILVNPNKRGSLVIHCGKTKHSGKNITSGVRYILIGFIGVKSTKILNVSQDDTNHLTLCLPDKRYYDYLWIPGKYDPMVINVSIINLKSRPEKLKIILERLKNLVIPENMRIDIKVKEANPGDYGTPFKDWTRLRSQAPEDQKSYYSRDIKRGEIGCFNSHMEVIQGFDPGGKQNSFLLVLEDDANFTRDFLYRIYQSVKELERGRHPWDAIDFGGESIDQKPCKAITDSVVGKGALFQAHSILYSMEGVEKLRGFSPKVITPWDDFLTAIRKEHPIEELNTFYKMKKFNMYNSYMKLSWQVSNGIHDTEGEDQVQERFPITPQQNKRGCEDFDMMNYYSYTNIDTCIETITNRFVGANSEMWKFHLSGIEGSLTPRYINNWQLSVTTARKLVGVLPLAEDSYIEIHQDRVRRIDNPPKNSIYIFPSYLLFKCSHCAVFYATGDTLF